MTDRPLTCEAFDALLPDYLEGRLDASAGASVKAHAAECERCGTLLADLASIRAQAGALPPLRPSRDLWAGIEARIGAPVVPLAAAHTRGRPRTVRAPWLAAAAAALVVATAGVTYELTRHSVASQSAATAPPSNGVVGAPSSVPAVAAPGASETRIAQGPDSVATPPAAGRPRLGARGALGVGTRPANLAREAAPYDLEIDRLRRILDERRGDLDSNTVAVLERSLRVIDDAIGQSRAALAKDPASRFLHDQLDNALDKKVELLRTAALLPART